MKTYLDRENFGLYYYLLDSPVWFSVEVDFPEYVIEGLKSHLSNMRRVNSWLDEMFEDVRSGRTPKEIPQEIKEILCPVPAAQERAVKQRKKDTEAGSNLRPQSSLKNVE